MTASLCLCLTAAQVDASHIPTNIALISATLRGAVAGALQDMTHSRMGGCEGRGLFIAELEQHEANWLVRHVLVDQLIERGFEVFTKSDSQACLGKLSFRLAALAIDGRGSLRSREITRTVRAEVTLRLTSGAADSLVWRHQGKEVRRDQVPRTVLDVVENDHYSFAKFVVAEQSWNKFVEPVIVSSLLGILVYLFFSNR